MSDFAETFIKAFEFIEMLYGENLSDSIKIKKAFNFYNYITKTQLKLK